MSKLRLVVSIYSVSGEVEGRKLQCTMPLALQLGGYFLMYQKH